MKNLLLPSRYMSPIAEYNEKFILSNYNGKWYTGQMITGKTFGDQFAEYIIHLLGYNKNSDNTRYDAIDKNGRRKEIKGCRCLYRDNDNIKIFCQKAVPHQDRYSLSYNISSAQQIKTTYCDDIVIAVMYLDKNFIYEIPSEQFTLDKNRRDGKLYLQKQHAGGKSSESMSERQYSISIHKMETELKPFLLLVDERNK